MVCKGCGVGDELWFGYCFDCASAGEARAAKRTVVQHVVKALENAKKGFWWEAKTDLKWAFGRLTRTGDYRANGYFDNEGINWR